MSSAARDDGDGRSRRDWLGFCAQAAIGTSAATVAVPLLRFVAPAASTPDPEEPTHVIVCRTDELSHNQARTVLLGQRLAIVFRTDTGSLRAFDATCTHLRCTVQFDSNAQVLRCACHGAAFHPDSGAPLQGPAARPLPSIPVQVRYDRIVIGT